MARAKLKFDEREITIGEDGTTFGRTSDNTISFLENSNISRNHADIKFHDGQFWLTDLGSSNGTSVNGQKVDGEIALNDGDYITLGNSVIVEFIVEDNEPENAGEGDEMIESESVKEAKTADEASKSKTPWVLGVAGAAVGLAVVFVAAAVLIPYMMTPECQAAARIVSPEPGDIVKGETEIKIEVKNAECLRRVIVVLNNEEVISLTEAPYTAKLDSNNYPALANGGLYGLRIVLEDMEGHQTSQPGAVDLAFETKEVETPTPTPTVEVTTTQTPAKTGQKQVSPIEIQKMLTTVVSKFTGGSFKYNLSNPEFLKEVQKKTADYAVEGYFEKANAYKEVINNSFVRERSLDVSMAFILAMSRSKFVPAKQDANEGLWQISNDFATVNLYNTNCGTETMSDPAQNCAAKVAASYLEDLVVKVFDGDIVYGVAAFGKNVQEAGAWRDTITGDRSDFWNIITDTKQREEIVRFFAAAVVTENPQRFGLKREQRISDLYPKKNA